MAAVTHHVMGRRDDVPALLGAAVAGMPAVARMSGRGFVTGRSLVAFVPVRPDLAAAMHDLMREHR